MKATNETFLIDPPSGWMYGFPKSVTKEEYEKITSLKQWCIDNGYPRFRADEYGEYFHVQINGDLSSINKTKSTRQKALAWWNNLPFNSQNDVSKTSHCAFYYGNKNYKSLTDKEIEEIWKNEIQLNVTNCGNKNCQNGVINGLNPKICKKCNPTNAKQFKQFNESLFKAYINKFSNEDKLLMLSILSCEISTVNPILNDLLNRISSYKGTK